MGVESAIDISAEQRETILTLLMRYLPGTAAWAYGSRTKWTSRPQSDLDLVVFATPEQRYRVGALRDAFEESDLPFRVDLFVWNDVPETFHKKIEAEHVELVPKPVAKVHADWGETTLGAVTKFLSGGTPAKHQPAYWNGSIPWVSAKDMKRFRLHDTEDHITADGLANGTRKVPAGSVLLLTRGMRLLDELPVCVTQAPMAFNQDVKALRPRPGVDSNFLPYLVLGNRHRLLSLVDLAGHGTGRLNSDELKALDILLPSAPEQRAIAHILGTLDDKIELNRRMNETLEAMARALFKSWFVDFDPVRAKMEGREAHLESDVWDLFPDTLDEEGKPRGWKTTELGDRVDILDARRVPLSSRERQKRQGNFPYRGATGVLDYIDDYLFDGIHVLLGEDGSVIKSDGTPFTQYVWDKFWVNNHAHVLKGKGISNELLFCFLNQVDVAPFVTGAVQLKLNQKNLKSIPFPPADYRVTTCVETVLSPLFEQVRANTEKSHTLTALRDALLPKLICGEVRLRDAESMVGAVA